MIRPAAARACSRRLRSRAGSPGSRRRTASWPSSRKWRVRAVLLHQVEQLVDQAHQLEPEGLERVVPLPVPVGVGDHGDPPGRRAPAPGTACPGRRRGPRSPYSEPRRLGPARHQPLGVGRPTWSVPRPARSAYTAARGRGAARRPVLGRGLVQLLLPGLGGLVGLGQSDLGLAFTLSMSPMTPPRVVRRRRLRLDGGRPCRHWPRSPLADGVRGADRAPRRDRLDRATLSRAWSGAVGTAAPAGTALWLGAGRPRRGPRVGCGRSPTGWWTAGEFDGATRRVAGRLRGAGLLPGDRVVWSTASSVAALGRPRRGPPGRPGGGAGQHRPTRARAGPHRGRRPPGRRRRRAARAGGVGARRARPADHGRGPRPRPARRRTRARSTRPTPTTRPSSASPRAPPVRPRGRSSDHRNLLAATEAVRIGPGGGARTTGWSTAFPSSTPTACASASTARCRPGARPCCCPASTPARWPMRPGPQVPRCSSVSPPCTTGWWRRAGPATCRRLRLCVSGSGPAAARAPRRGHARPSGRRCSSATA